MKKHHLILISAALVCIIASIAIPAPYNSIALLLVAAALVADIVLTIKSKE